VKIEAHGWLLALLPELGGAIGHLRHDGCNVLRATPADARDALETACFPLVPYANRIAHGRFEFGGNTHQLPLNFGDHPHSLHGLGWQSAWQIVQSGSDHAVLRHEHDGGAGWPWPYRAEQHFTLARGIMQVELSLTNLAQHAVPAGLGLHPYFPLDAATRLQFAATRMWQVDATILPTVPVAPDHLGDWSSERTLADDWLIDNSFERWNGSATVSQESGAVHMEAQGASVLHLYRPAGCDFFCVEPVSHLPDAINRAGMPLVAAGETAALSMILQILPAPPTRSVHIRS
jgi:aldose 1-epimerase